MAPVVIVHDYAHVNGGASLVALSSAEGLARRGQKVHLFSAVGPVDKKLAQTPNLTVHCLGIGDLLGESSRLRAFTQGLWNRGARRSFAALLDSLLPEQPVVHYHLWYKALSSSVVAEAVRRGLKTVLTLHDYTAVCPNGTFYSFPEGSICRRKPMGASCILTNCDARMPAHKAWRLLRTVVQDRAGRIPRDISTFVFVSDFSRSIIEPHLPKGARCLTVGNPVDVPRMEPAPVAAASDALFVGRLSAEKGAILFAKAAGLAGVRPVFIGDGQLKEAVQASNPAALLKGWLPRDEVFGAMRKSRCLVLPSLWYETQGLVVAEAAALGVPAVVPDSSAAREMVVDGVTGHWFSGGDVQDLARKLSLLKDPAHAEVTGQAAYRRFWDNPMTLDRHLDALQRLYAGLRESTAHPHGQGTRRQAAN
jgi:glycosyltransferase involved in cell wall biosynthesis